MGRRGPLPNFALRALKAHSSHKKRVKSPPVPSGLPVAMPEPPEWLSPAALEEWQRITPVLLAAGTVTLADKAIITMYTVSYGNLVEAQRDLLARGPMLPPTKPKRKPVPNPSEALARRALGHLLVAAKELGLTPGSRLRLQGATPPPTPPNDLDLFRSRHDA